MQTGSSHDMLNQLREYNAFQEVWLKGKIFNCAGQWVQDQESGFLEVLQR